MSDEGWKELADGHPVLRQRNWRVGFRLTRRYGPLSPSKESASKPATALLQSVVSIMDAVEHSKHKTTADNTAGRENKHPGCAPRGTPGVFRRVCASDAARGSDRPPPPACGVCANEKSGDLPWIPPPSTRRAAPEYFDGIS